MTISDEPITNSDIPDITLTISKGQRASATLQYSELIETGISSSNRSFNNRDFSALVKFKVAGDYLFFIRTLGNDVLDDDNEEDWLWFGNLSADLLDRPCQNRVVKDTPLWYENLNFFLNCPTKANLSASGDAKYILTVLLKVSE